MASFSKMSDEELLAEFAFWDREVRNATSWGAALGQAASWRDAVERELCQRGLLPEPAVRSILISRPSVQIEFRQEVETEDQLLIRIDVRVIANNDWKYIELTGDFDRRAAIECLRRLADALEKPLP